MWWETGIATPQGASLSQHCKVGLGRLWRATQVRKGDPTTIICPKAPKPAEQLRAVPTGDADAKRHSLD